MLSRIDYACSLLEEERPQKFQVDFAVSALQTYSKSRSDKPSVA